MSLVIHNMATLTQSLRCIGQDFERFPRSIRDLNIEASDSSYIVRVTVNLLVDQSVEEGVRETRRATEGPHADNRDDTRVRAATKSFELRYTAKDIDYLEREGIAKRRNPKGTPDFLSLSHILRTAGARVEKESGQLIGVSRRVQSEGIQSLVIKFRNYRGEEREEEYVGSSVYDLCVHWYKQRNGGAIKLANL
jgi:hypothetical protein